MLNHIVLMGRLTRDVELRIAQATNTAIASFTIAVDRDKDNTDFISCKAFGKTAEFVKKCFAKGNMIAVVGSIQTGSYTNKEGNTVYTTDVVVRQASFTGEKRVDGHAQATSTLAASPQENSGFYPVDDDGDMPF